jgi:hypothetical protein
MVELTLSQSTRRDHLTQLTLSQSTRRDHLTQLTLSQSTRRDRRSSKSVEDLKPGITLRALIANIF